MPLAEAKALGAMSLFGEKYGNIVRMVEIGGEFSRELCGGTHVGTSSEIGSLTLLTEQSVGSGNRRVEALVGMNSFEHLAAERTLVNQLTSMMKVQSSSELPEKINQTLAKLKSAEKELEKLRREKLQAEAGKLLEKRANHRWCTSSYASCGRAGRQRCSFASVRFTFTLRL